MEKTEIITNENVKSENVEIIRPIITNGIVNIDNGKIITIENVKENGDIVGFTNDNVKALYKYDINKWFFGKDISRLNLVSLSDRTKEERLEIVSKSHQKARENRENKKNFNELAKSMLDVALSEKQAEKLLQVDSLPDFIDKDNLNVGAVMIAKGIQECLESGSFKWFESIRDTAGYKPKNEVELQADIMTDADKALIEKLEKRIG